MACGMLSFGGGWPFLCNSRRLLTCSCLAICCRAWVCHSDGVAQRSKTGANEKDAAQGSSVSCSAWRPVNHGVCVRDNNTSKAGGASRLRAARVLPPRRCGAEVTSRRRPVSLTARQSVSSPDLVVKFAFVLIRSLPGALAHPRATTHTGGAVRKAALCHARALRHPDP